MYFKITDDNENHQCSSCYLVGIKYIATVMCLTRVRLRRRSTMDGHRARNRKPFVLLPREGGYVKREGWVWIFRITFRGAGRYVSSAYVRIPI